jgi:hypothetical protein
MATAQSRTRPVKKAGVQDNEPGYKLSALRAEAARKDANRKPPPEIDPFIIKDVEPPIVITAPVEVGRVLVIMDCVGRNGEFDMANALPLLRALCGDQFGRVWSLIADNKTDSLMVAIIQKMMDHFKGLMDVAMEAQKQPGGSEGSSD